MPLPIREREVLQDLDLAERRLRLMYVLNTPSQRAGDPRKTVAQGTRLRNAIAAMMRRRTIAMSSKRGG